MVGNALSNDQFEVSVSPRTLLQAVQPIRQFYHSLRDEAAYWRRQSARTPVSRSRAASRWECERWAGWFRRESDVQFERRRRRAMNRWAGQFVLAIASAMTLAAAFRDRSNHSALYNPTPGERVLARCIWLGGFVFLVLVTVALGWIGYPSMHRTGAFAKVGIMLLPIGLFVVAPLTLLFEDSLIVFPIIYCGGAVLAGASSWDVWEMLTMDRFGRLVFASLWAVAVGLPLLGITGLIIYFE